MFSNLSSNRTTVLAAEVATVVVFPTDWCVPPLVVVGKQVFTGMVNNGKDARSTQVLVRGADKNLGLAATDEEITTSRTNPFILRGVDGLIRLALLARPATEHV
ncbi:hypothetical protein NOR_06702 [Metarhizium rileyi]|uniref:Uncharacterized protein n=1 Tax=Metarhizium rileyi (strain RCEF 4871) TaxID=1649241 RepID=A0A166ZWH9_METRR|nr:hypothetical protein NOR_06702 [Metarhizium rileyi RCEF 4871]